MIILKKPLPLSGLGVVLLGSQTQDGLTPTARRVGTSDPHTHPTAAKRYLSPSPTHPTPCAINLLNAKPSFCILFTPKSGHKPNMGLPLKGFGHGTPRYQGLPKILLW